MNISKKLKKLYFNFMQKKMVCIYIQKKYQIFLKIYMKCKMKNIQNYQKNK